MDAKGIAHGGSVINKLRRNMCLVSLHIVEAIVDELHVITLNT